MIHPVEPRVSVLMPTFNQAAFIRRALESLFAQTLADWELIIIDDGSTDTTSQIITPWLDDQRVRFERFERNRGLGASLNYALELARAPFIAYLPSDDLLYPNHLASLVALLEAQPEAVIAYAGVQYRWNTRRASGQIEGFALQLVQVVHHRTAERWVERGELVTDDLERMFWARLFSQGVLIASGQVTCEWTWHPLQRHRIITETEGGLNRYRSYYNVAEPLRFHSTIGNNTDEVALYQRFRERPDTPLAVNGLKILLVGELAYNPERVLALEERGHQLYGLWTPEPFWWNTVGPLPFGHVTDLPHEHWREAIRELQPDVIYALLNWQAVRFANMVQSENPDIPFVWHFKEGPFLCFEKGLWAELVQLFERADGQIFASSLLRDWFEVMIPGLTHNRATLVLDGDLPKREWFSSTRSPLLSAADGAIHTVVPGRPIGLHAHVVESLAQQNIHLHFYGDYTQGQWRDWIQTVQGLAPNHLHLHANVTQERWVEEFSQYDAGWLHLFESHNGGDIRRATWDDLNVPARVATLAAAGVPMIQRDNTGNAVAMQQLVRERDMGVFFSTAEDLAAQLRDAARIAEVRANVWAQRETFTFDAHADTLMTFFRRVIAPSR